MNTRNFGGIRGRLIGTYLLLTLLAVVLIEGLFLAGVRQYYLSNIRDTLEQQADLATQFYGQYLQQRELAVEAPDLADSFAAVTSARVQIIDRDGLVLAESPGGAAGTVIDTPDARSALDGSPGLWEGNPTGEEPVLAVSAPLQRGGEVVGAVRYLTSLGPLSEVMRNLTLFLILIGAVIELLVAATGFLLSRTVIRPVEEITAAAQRIARGDLTVQVPKHYDDEVGRLADTLNHMTAELGRLDRLKNEFISSVSHELRTPLTSIKGWTVTMLSGTGLDQEQVRGLEIVDRETDRLSALVDTLLDFSRLQAGRLSLRQVQLNVVELAQTVAEQMRPRAERQGLALTFAAEQPVAIVLGDPDRLKQVLINLVDNALKFSPREGEVAIRVSTHDSLTAVSVADSGPGIPPEELPLVTQRFYQGQNAAAGSGLGLALAREIMDLHKGDLAITSPPGGGTTVTLYLPHSLTVSQPFLTL